MKRDGKTSMRSYVFWQNMLSIHQSATIRALTEFDDVTVTLICERHMDFERQRLGWPIPDFGAAEVLVDPEKAEIDRLIQGSDSDTVHVFSGIRAYPMVRDGFLRVQATDSVIGILAETADWTGLRGIVRWLKGRTDAKHFRDRIGFVLGIGTLGVDWYRKVGFDEEQVYPFGYFLEEPNETFNMEQVCNRNTRRTVDIIFVGRCVKQKGIDLLLHALSRIDVDTWNLTVIGDGPVRTYLQKLSAKLSISSNVSFTGSLPHPTAMQVLQSKDLLVLPSRGKDGWGAVVNEALMRGIPAICSDFCGSKDLLHDPTRGAIFPAGNVDALTRVLREEIARGPADHDRRTQIKTWSHMITGKVAAEYIAAVTESVTTGTKKPTPPWQ